MQRGLSVGVLILTVALALLVAAASSAPLLPLGGSRIESLTHSARSALRAGDRITVTMRGTAGGSATFHIFGVVTNVGMREIKSAGYQAQPSLYTGTYIVRPGDAARSAVLFATLTVGGQETMAGSSRPITIDTRGPVITSRQPKPGATLTNVRPNILVNFFDAASAVNPGAVRLVVNRQNVTARASISENSAAYNPEVPFASGSVHVQVTATDRAGNAERAEWSFTVAPGATLIRSVTINPATALTPGDILTVVVTGTPGGKASFAIQGLAGFVLMRESRTPGIYFGTLTATAGIFLVEAPLLVTLDKDGRRSAAPASVGVTIVGALPAAPVTVSSGRAIVLGDEAVVRTVLRGRSRPGFRILGRLFSVSRSQSAGDQIQLAEFVTVAGADGTWQVAIGPLIAPEGTRILASVVAIDPAGQRSAPTVMEVSQ